MWKQFRKFAEMTGISCIATVVDCNTIGFYHKSSPQPFSPIVYSTLAPMLCRQKRQSQVAITMLLIPRSLNHFHCREPALYQSTRTNTTKQFHLRIIGKKTSHTRFVQMIEMIVADKQIINISKYGRIGRKLASALYERNTPIYRIYHKTLSSYLQEKRVMTKPYQCITHYSIQRTKKMNLRIPFYRSFFLTLRIGGKTPFKHTTHSRTPAMLTIEKLPLNNWISSPTGINRMQTLIFTKGNALPHSIKFDKSPIFFLEADRFTDYFSSKSFKKASSSSSSPFSNSSLSNKVSSSSISKSSETVSFSSSTSTNE